LKTGELLPKIFFSQIKLGVEIQVLDQLFLDGYLFHPTSIARPKVGKKEYFMGRTKGFLPRSRLARSILPL
jgi:hypothetical protein